MAMSRSDSGGRATFRAAGRSSSMIVGKCWLWRLVVGKCWLRRLVVGCGRLGSCSKDMCIVGPRITRVCQTYIGVVPEKHRVVQIRVMRSSY